MSWPPDIWATDASLFFGRHTAMVFFLYEKCYPVYGVRHLPLLLPCFFFLYRRTHGWYFFKKEQDPPFGLCVREREAAVASLKFLDPRIISLEPKQSFRLLPEESVPCGVSCTASVPLRVTRCRVSILITSRLFRAT